MSNSDKLSSFGVMTGMLDPQTGWLVSVVFSLVIGLGFAFWKGAATGLGIAVVASCLFPDWLEYPLAGMPFTVRTTVCALAIFAYALRYPWRIKSPLIPLDFAVAGLVVAHTITDYHYGVGWLAGLRGYGEWALPYVCGRYALRRNENPVILGWAVCTLLVLLSIGAMIEVATKTNVWEVVFGNRSGQFPRDAMRYGLKRAYGNTIHPIFYAMQLVVLLPWPIYLWRATENVSARTIAGTVLLIAFIGSISTVSRSPILAFIAVPVFALAVKFVWARWLAGLAVIAVLVLMFQSPVDFTKDAAAAAGDEFKQVYIGDEKVPISSLMTRFWLYRVYWPALQDGGLLGYGTQATSEFPVDVPKRPKNADTLYMFRWIDNAYILLGLRFGLIGLIAYVIFLLTAIGTGLSLRRDRYWSTMAISFASTYLTLAMMLLSVWMSYDFGFEALWMAGVIGGIRSEQ